MKTKTCTKCGLEKPIEQFVVNKAKKDGHGSNCKECHRKTCNRYYQKNKNTVRKNAKLHKERLKQFINSFKESGCILCGERDLACLDLHHIQDKLFTISQNITNFSKDVLEKELKKCVVLCSNCHRKLHYYNWNLEIGHGSGS